MAITKLWGIRSVFSKMNSTGRPARTAIVSLSYDIRSNSVPIRITRTPSSSSSPRKSPRVGRRQQPGQRVGELQRVDRFAVGAFGDGHRGQVFDDRFEDRPGFVFRPVGPRQRTQRANGGCPIARDAHEGGQRAERGGFAAADVRQGEHRRVAHGGGRVVVADFDRHAASRRGNLLAAKNFLAGAVEHREREALQALAQVAFIAVDDDYRFDRHFAAQVDFPPGVGRVFFGVRLAARAEVAALVAVDGPAGFAAVSGVLLRSLAPAGDVLTTADDFHLGQGQRTALSAARSARSGHRPRADSISRPGPAAGPRPRARSDRRSRPADCRRPPAAWRRRNR